ncbi:EAL domain-containing protein [Vibrio sinensis]|uniref:EAL domain-containing protein n=1 Tax=Vibrio sinensis TaxID=2302434 RepID=A0A3A6QR38_9VIBR|nr:EAL domain-containing protein [Vibrio sinensis]RJX75390.1 EAL domain-containing protein [Vibrio sinensis]
MKNISLYSTLTKISENPYINGLCNVFVMLLPITLLSAFSMLAGSSIGEFGHHALANKIFQVSNLVWKLFPILLVVYFSLFLASYHRVSRANVITPSLLIYVVLCTEWDLMHTGSVVPSNYPLAIVIPFIVCLTISCLERRKLLIDSTLPNVADQSLNLVGATIFIVVLYVTAGIALKSGLDSISGVWDVLPSFQPDSLVDALIYETVRNLLWSMGINGHIILASFKGGLHQYTLDSFAAYHEFGTALPILTSNFYDMYGGIGGAGNTLSLVLCMLLFTKNKGYRKLAAATLVLSCFNINEPIVFGLPIIFNPVLIIPFVLAPLAGLLIGYFATSIGFVSPASEIISWMTPPFISGYLATGKDIAASVVQLVIVIVGMMIYLPFFRQMNKVTGSNKIFSKGLSDNFFNYQDMGSTRSVIGLFPQMSGNLTAQRQIADLQKNGEFILYYQPQINIKSNSAQGVEALIRYRSDDGKITPPIFLEHFSKLGMTSELDLWVIRRALEETGPLASDPHFKVSINISPVTFLVPEFASTVQRYIEESQLRYEQVELEITEDLLIHDEKSTWQVFQQLRKLGIQIALDDFGSGYSSIGYLSRFEFDKVKIDRSLVLNIHNKNGREMFRLTSQLVKTTGAEIVVEGVESLDEVEFMDEQNIQLIQGFFFHKPMPFEELVQKRLFDVDLDMVSSNSVGKSNIDDRIIQGHP